MKQSEFVRWLVQRGARFEEGAKHLRVFCNGEQSTLPRHPSKELKQPLIAGVKKKLKLK